MEELNAEEDEQKEDEKEEENHERGKEFEYADKLYITYKRENMLKQYNALCTELKQLYVCITRPKKRLIIYDESNENRDQMLRFWSQLSAVDIITEDMIRQSLLSIEELSQDQKQIMLNLIESQPHLQHLNEQEKEENRLSRKRGWKMQGIKMFKRRFYEQAIKCFQNAEEETLQKRAQAYFFAEKGSTLMSQNEQILNKLTDFSSTLSKVEKRELKMQLKGSQKESKEFFQRGSELFIELGLKKQAA